jgi:hypothetical protein
MLKLPFAFHEAKGKQGRMYSGRPVQTNIAQIPAIALMPICLAISLWQPKLTRILDSTKDSTAVRGLAAGFWKDCTG